ncbi:MAG: hypothetical protein AAF669_07485 [Pseudomonadota bacterium]
MAMLDKTKEQIGWLKVVFALLVAIDVSLIGWLAQNFNKAEPLLIFIAVLIVGLLGVAVVAISYATYRKIESLGSL